MSATRQPEFRFMARRERIKIEVIKTVSLLLIAWTLYSLVFGEASTSARLNDAAMTCAASFVYFNMFRVRSEVVELFEPPYDFKGAGMSLLVGVFVIASIWFQISEG